MIKSKFEADIKRLWSDNTIGFIFFLLIILYQPIFKLKELYEFSCVNTPQQNGVVERKNGNFVATIHTFLFQKNVPKHYWGDYRSSYK